MAAYHKTVSETLQLLLFFNFHVTSSLETKIRTKKSKSGGIAKATISSTFDSIRIQFDRATDMGGQQSRIADLYGSNQETSGCARFKFSRPPLLSLTLPTHIDLN